MSNWKERIGVLYSTNKDYEYQTNEKEECKTLEKDKQKLKVSLEKKGRKGKEVTIVYGFVGKEDDLEKLGQILKKRLGIGGSSKEREIILQGNQCSKVVEMLKSLGYSNTK